MVDTILVTGSNGQLGRSLRALAEKDQKNQWIFCSRQDLDITNREKIEQIFVEHQPTHCINCAAFTNVRLAEKEPDNARRINVDGVDNLIEACNNFDTTLVHLSTDYVFDGEKSSPYTEDDEVNPLNVYGQTKAAGEALVAASKERLHRSIVMGLCGETRSEFLSFYSCQSQNRRTARGR
jgi:dTDP-4-dehydrorhamnose reductase